MLSDRELEALLLDLESDRVERKGSVGSDTSKIRQTICAFANDFPNYRQPGVLFIGIDDKGGCAGLPITDELLKNLSVMRNDGKIQPFPMITVQKKVLQGCEVAVIEVQPSDNPPLRLDGRTYIRVGPTLGIATASEEVKLAEKRRSGDMPFDRRPIVNASTDDLDLDLFQNVYLPSVVSAEILAENHRTLQEQLAAVHFLANGVPNNGAILTVGKDPSQWLAGAYIQFLRIDGTELTDPIINQREINGSLLTLLRQLDEILEANIAIATDITGSSVEKQYPDYPIEALRQLTRNAVLHRTYEATNAPIRISWFSDRIEILSPGGPFGEVNKENFGKGVTDYRNPLLAEALKATGFVQKFGFGILSARQALARNGSPELEYQIENYGILAIVRKRS
jgi:ATP-dependent DNA helicase RecG